MPSTLQVHYVVGRYRSGVLDHASVRSMDPGCRLNVITQIDMRDVEMSEKGRESHRTSTPAHTAVPDQGPPIDDMMTERYRRLAFVICEDVSKMHLRVAFVTQSEHDIIGCKACEANGPINRAFQRLHPPLHISPPLPRETRI